MLFYYVATYCDGQLCCRTSLLKRRPKLHLPFNALVTTLSFGLALPVAIALFPQISHVSVLLPWHSSHRSLMYVSCCHGTLPTNLSCMFSVAMALFPQISHVCVLLPWHSSHRSLMYVSCCHGTLPTDLSCKCPVVIALFPQISHVCSHISLK